MARKKKTVQLEDAGGNLEWTEDGMTIFIPQDIVGDWPAVELFYDEETESIIIRRVKI